MQVFDLVESDARMPATSQPKVSILSAAADAEFYPNDLETQKCPFVVNFYRD